VEVNELVSDNASFRDESKTQVKGKCNIVIHLKNGDHMLLA